jgi:hypothetical protein
VFQTWSLNLRERHELRVSKVIVLSICETKKLEENYVINNFIILIIGLIRNTKF